MVLRFRKELWPFGTSGVENYGQLDIQTHKLELYYFLYILDFMKMNTKISVYLKRMGLAAFIFFSLKGLAWIAIFYFGWQVIG